MIAPHYQDERVTVYAGDCLDVLRELDDASVDAVVTDPPYGLEFMSKDWDAPWRAGEGINVNDAGLTGTGYTDGANRLPRPTFTGSTNPRCENCRGHKRGKPGGSFGTCVCDSPKFPNIRAVEMRAFQQWCEMWATECLRVLKPGGHMLAFGGTRTWHRLACAIEDAGFEVRDSIAWLYGSGFPKSLDVSKAIDKAAGVAFSERPASGVGFMRPDGRDGYNVTKNQLTREGESTDDARTWQGWGTALKPAFEPIVVARKPLTGTVAANVLEHGTGALNIDGCRIGTDSGTSGAGVGPQGDVYGDGLNGSFGKPVAGLGRWPANVVLDESQAAALDAMSGELTSGSRKAGDHELMGYMGADLAPMPEINGDRGGASRFFYTAKAPGTERVKLNGTAHPTVKPLDLMRWLVRLVTPTGGIVLDPFAGSGTTVEACLLEGFRCIAIEREPDYLPLIMQRVNRRIDPVAAVRATHEDRGLFDLLDDGGAA